jgi:hypothetical protein
MEPWSSMMAGKMPLPSGFVNLAITVSCLEPLMVTISEENAGAATRIPMSAAITIRTDIASPLLFTFVSSIK